MKEHDANAIPAEPALPVPGPAFFARRGQQWLTKDDLQAHLAALIRLENVAVLLGSGASVGELGGMTMGQLWTMFVKDYPTSHEWLVKESFLASTSTIPDVEALADQLEIARSEWTRQRKPIKVRQLDSAQCDLQRAVVRAAILKQEWWNSPESIVENPVPLRAHRDVLLKLTAARQPGQPSPWVFTTNYDLAVEWACESIGLKVSNGFEGLHFRMFAPHNFDLGYRNTLTRGEARFGTYNIYLAKLHGSLSWTTSADLSSYLEAPTRQLWPSIETFLDVTKPAKYPGPIVFPAAAKYMQTVGFVLGELTRRFTEALSRPQTCLITSGYSYSDDHVNRIIASALQNPTLQLVVYAPEARKVGGDLDLESCSNWIKRIASVESPQVTIVGGGSAAYFSELAAHLPDSALLDEQAMNIQDMLRKAQRHGIRDGELPVEDEEQ